MAFKHNGHHHHQSAIPLENKVWVRKFNRQFILVLDKYSQFYP